MSDAEVLKAGRNLLLKLHKTMVDYERATYETFNGPKSSGEFLNVLLNDPDFEWLRRFSTLIVDIDEMFAQKNGFSEGDVAAHLERMRSLTAMEGEDDFFRAKYQIILQNDLDAASIQAELKQLLRTN
jgi:hypothetical protein